MNEWELFLERGKKDLDISQKVFQDNHDYEIASYIAQQALEKHLKAYLLKTRVVEKPEDLGHFQIPHILTIVGEHFNTIKRNTDKSNLFHLVMEHMTNILDHLKKLFDTIKNNNERLVHWWKYSIKIEQNVEDEDYKKFIDMMSRSGGRLKKSFETYTQKILNNSMEQSTQISNQLPSEILEVAEKMVEATSQLKNKEIISQNQTKEFAKSELNILKKIIELQKLGKIKGNISIADLEKALIVSDVLVNYIDLIMRTHPHAIIGRYPIVVENEITSTQLYKKHKDDVWNLITDVKKSCNQIEISIDDN